MKSKDGVIYIVRNVLFLIGQSKKENVLLFIGQKKWVSEMSKVKQLIRDGPT